MTDETLRARRGARPEAGPTTLADRYRLVELLGRGGMGAVYRAIDLALGEPIAVKLLDAHLLGSRAGRDDAEPPAERVERLRREVRMARRVTHRNVARVHDIGEDPSGWFITMQLVDGTTLRSELDRRGTLPVAEALEIVAEMCAGVAAAHAAGVLHLDLKPENVMRTPGGGIVVLDFGVARAVDDDGTGGVGGTPAYMAPEQRGGGACDVRTDLYAIGVVLYELLAGRRPREAEGLVPVSEHATEVGSPFSNTDVRPVDLVGASPSLRSLLDDLLSYAPERRPASATAVLEAIHTELGIPRVPQPPARVGRTRLRLAVLPFAQRGAKRRPPHDDLGAGRSGEPSDGADDDTLAAGLTEELVDRLSGLRDASVLATSATTRYLATCPPGGADPVAAGAALGVSTVVEGSVQRAGDMVRVTARLVETERGEIAWNERFEAPMRDVLGLQDRIAQRIAEALRVELATLPYRGVAPPDALELYMRARAKFVRLDLSGPHGAIADAERACELAPGFAPAIALHALTCARAWFFGGTGSTGDVDQLRAHAIRAVARAREEAPGYAETTLAAAVLAFQGGDLATAMEQFSRTLDAAPSHPVALEYSGRLLCEAGHATEGFRRIELATELDPTLWIGLVEIARHFALHRAWYDYEATLERITKRSGGPTAATRSLMMRVALWRGRTDELRRVCADVEVYDPGHRILGAHAATHLGKLELEELEAALDEHLSHHVSRRYASFAHQCAAELAGSRGRHALAMRHLELASSAGLIDLEWLDLCPVLAGARGLDGFAVVRRAVRARVAELWTPSPTASR